VIAVRDTGIGMLAEQRATVFEPFVQFDNSLTRQEKGTGLGMPISRELARGMGGDLTVDSEPGVGTEFVLTLVADGVSSAASRRDS
jgi:signal transduction histidine kinase